MSTLEACGKEFISEQSRFVGKAVSSVVDAINATFNNSVAGAKELLLWMTVSVGRFHDEDVIAPTVPPPQTRLSARCAFDAPAASNVALRCITISAEESPF